MLIHLLRLLSLAFFYLLAYMPATAQTGTLAIDTSAGKAIK